jgi:hypothetical protein
MCIARAVVWEVKLPSSISHASREFVTIIMSPRTPLGERAVDGGQDRLVLLMPGPKLRVWDQRGRALRRRDLLGGIGEEAIDETEEKIAP